MYTYFLILNDYGIRPTAVWKMATEKGFFPATTDVYSTSAAGYGNSVSVTMMTTATATEIED